MDTKKIKTPTFGAAISILVVIVAILMASLLWLNIDIRIALMFAIIVASVYAMYLGFKWDDVEKMMKDGVYSLICFLLGRQVKNKNLLSGREHLYVWKNICRRENCSREELS